MKHITPTLAGPSFPQMPLESVPRAAIPLADGTPVPTQGLPPGMVMGFPIPNLYAQRLQAQLGQSVGPVVLFGLEHDDAAATFPLRRIASRYSSSTPQGLISPPADHAPRLDAEPADDWLAAFPDLPDDFLGDAICAGSPPRLGAVPEAPEVLPSEIFSSGARPPSPPFRLGGELDSMPRPYTPSFSEILEGLQSQSLPQEEVDGPQLPAQTQDGSAVTVSVDLSGGTSDGGGAVDIHERVRAEVLKRKKPFSRLDIESACNLNPKRAKVELGRLREEGVIGMEGFKRSARYVLLSKQPKSKPGEPSQNPYRGQRYKVREEVLRRTEPFSKTDIDAACPDVPVGTVRLVLTQMKRDGLLTWNMPKRKWRTVAHPNAAALDQS